MNVISDVFAIILIMIMVYVGPIFGTFKSTDDMVDSMVKNTVIKFESDVRKSGYIDSDSYFKLLRELSKTGRVYTVEMEHTDNLVYPDQDVEGDYKLVGITYGTKNILNTIKDGNTKYTMKYGDDFKVIVSENEMAPSRAMIGMISNSAAIQMSFSGGGMVENEVDE